MNKLRTDIKLLEIYIEDKWIPICRAEKIGQGAEDCALCETYTECRGCPIGGDTGNLCNYIYEPKTERWFCFSSNYSLARNRHKQGALNMLFYLIDLQEKLIAQLPENLK